MKSTVSALILGTLLPLHAAAEQPAGRDPMSAIKIDLSGCSRNDPLCGPPPVPPTRQQVVAALVDAAGKGDLRALQEALAAGAPVDGRNGAGDTALAAAAFNKQLGAVRALLAARANPNIPAGSGNVLLRPLCLAGFAGQKGIADALLAAGAAPQAHSLMDDQGQPMQLSAVACAAAGGNADTLAAVLQKGGSPDADKAVKNARAPLYFAVTKNHVSIATALCNAKASPNVVVRDASLLRLALREKRYPMAAALLQCKANPNWRDANGVSELRALVRAGDLEGINLLGRYKPDYKEKLNGQTVMEEAVAADEPRIKVLRALLAGGASPRGERLVGPILKTWLSGSGWMDQNAPMDTMQLMRDLLAGGASAGEMVDGDTLANYVLSRRPNFYGQTGLYELFMDLVKADPAPNAPDMRGNLPLVQAYLQMKINPEKVLALVDLFVAKGIDINARQPSDGRNLLDTVASYNDMQIRKALQDRGACRASRRVDNEWRYCN